MSIHENLNCSELVGRERTIDSVASFLSDVKNSHGGAKFIVGPPGIGKSSILKTTLKNAVGFNLVNLVCTEVHSGQPFGILFELIDEMNGKFSNGSSYNLFAMYKYIFDLFKSVCKSPTLIVVDDLQLIDADSLKVLELLVRRINSIPLGFLSALRKTPPQAIEIAKLLENEGAATFEELEPLSFESSVMLIEREIKSKIGDRRAREVYNLCSGNPLLLKIVSASNMVTNCLSDTSIGLEPSSFLRSLSDKDFTNAGDNFVDSGLNIKSMSSKLLLSRFAGVNVESLKFLQAASVLGTNFRISDAFEISGLNEGKFVEATNNIRGLGLIEILDQRFYRFIHPLFKEVIYNDMNEIERSRLHLNCVKLFVSLDRDISEVAFHIIRAKGSGSFNVEKHLFEAAKKAMSKGANDTALYYLEEILKSNDEVSDPQILIELGFVYHSKGNIFKATGIANRLLQMKNLNKSERCDALRLISRCHTLELILGIDNRSMREFRKISASEIYHELKVLNRTKAAEILLESSFTSWLFSGRLGVGGKTPSVIESVKNLGIIDPFILSSSLTADGIVKLFNCDPEGYNLIEDAVNLISKSEDFRLKAATSSWNPIWGQMMVLKCSEDYELENEIYDDAINYGNANGLELASAFYAVSHFDVLIRMGKLPEALSLIDMLNDLTLIVPSVHPFVASNLAIFYSEFGDTKNTRRWLAEAKASVPKRAGLSIFIQLLVSSTQIQYLLGSGNVLEACEVAQNAIKIAKKMNFRNPCLLPWFKAAIDALFAGKAVGDIQRVVNLLEDALADLTCKTPQAVLSYGNALKSDLEGKYELSEFNFENALVLLRSISSPLVLGEVLLSYGRFLRRKKEITRSRRILAEGLFVLQNTQANRLILMLEQELSATGGRKSNVSPYSKELTKRETAVTSLASKGLTNIEIAAKLYISSKTVDHHLSRSYAKLGIKSRRELPEVIEEQG